MTHAFGSDWTEEKLGKVRAYLQAYQRALKNQRFKRTYVDAFAGTGYREERTTAPEPELRLFAHLEDGEPQTFRDGSARIALEIDPPFDEYIFIEKNEFRFAKLKDLAASYPQLTERIRLKNADCNHYLREFCARDWGFERAVVFLDPYGMQVEWQTMEALAETQSIDVWILFPLGVAVNRLLAKSGNMRRSWEKRLDLIFGTHSWYSAFYEPEDQLSFDLNQDGSGDRLIKHASFDDIAGYYVNRLKTIFCGVADNPVQLKNMRGNPLYLLCFACSNPKGKSLALRLARHILGKP